VATTVRSVESGIRVALTFYMDETGNRLPDKKSDTSRDGRDWFAFGGILINQEDETAAKSARDAAAADMGVNVPFHITDMLARAKGFRWLNRRSTSEQRAFWDRYQQLLTTLPVVGFACVIDRPGYVARGYVEKHGNDRWLLCRSAFDIAVERAAKYASRSGRRLRVIFEGDVGYNAIVEGYFERLKAEGLGFDEANSEKYKPLSKDDFAATLTTIENRSKSNRLLQMADSYIYTMARSHYEKSWWLYKALRDAKKISNFALGGDANLIREMGVKAYCFD
jgi:hypothetical protein